MRPLLILRPDPPARETLARATAFGLDAHSLPLFALTPAAWEVPDPLAYFGLLLTSVNAVRYGGAGLQQLIYMPVFAVGEATASAARDAGFASVVAGDGDVARLLSRIATLAPQQLLHLCGRDFRDVDVPGIGLDRRIVYEAGAAEPPVEFTGLLRQSPVAMIHSPRSGARFAALCDLAGADRRTISIAAISANAAAATGTGWQSLAIATNPRDDALLSAADGLCREN